MGIFTQDKMYASNILGLFFSILETYVFIGIFYGWHEMNRILKDEGVFADKCGVPVGLASVEGSGASNGTDACEPQDQEFQRIFQVGYSLGMILSFPQGLFLDRFGEVPTRLGAGCVYTLGWIILSCYKLNEYCLYAWMLLSISGFTMLISNYTSMNYYMPKLIGTSITLLCGVFDASASMGKILGVIYDAGVSLQTIFITMAVLSLLTIIKSSLLHPYTKIPAVLPNDFAIFDYSIVGYMLGRTPDHADPQETEPLHKEEENTQDDEEEEKEPEEEATFCSSILSVDYVFSVIWYLILCVRMSSWFAWIQTWSETLQLSPTEMTEFQYIKGFFFYFSIPIAVLPGAIVDFCSARYNSKRTGVIIILIIASGAAALFSGLQATSVNHLVIAETSVFFGVLARTFTYGSYAAFVNLTFDTKFFGSIMGLTSVMCGAISFANDPFFAYIISPDGLDRNFKPVDIGFAVACCVSLIQPMQMITRSVYQSIFN